LVLGRPTPLPITGTIAEIVRAHGHDRDVMHAVFAFEASYGTRVAGAFTVVASTNPLREGQALLALDGFSYAEEHGLVTQWTHADNGAPIERLFTVDTMEAAVAFPTDTATTPAGRQWLARESLTLLASARRPG